MTRLLCNSSHRAYRTHDAARCLSQRTSDARRVCLAAGLKDGTPEIALILQEMAHSVQRAARGHDERETHGATLQELRRVDAERRAAVRSVWQRDERDMYPPH